MAWLFSGSDAGQGVAVDFAIKVERKNVGHARDVVEHPHDAARQRRVGELILRTGLIEQQAAVGLVGGQDSLGEEVEQGIDDVVTGQVDVGHFLAIIDAAPRQLAHAVESLSQRRRQSADKATLKLAREQGFSLIDADCTVAAQAPKLAPYREQMRQTMAQAMGVDVSRVGVKATTTEHLGFVGREEGIAAWSVVLLDKDSGQ